MIAADDESTIAGANKAAGRLLGRQSVHVLIGSFANVLNLPLLVLSKHYQTPLLMPRATDEALIGQTVAYSLTPDDQRQGRLLAQFILKHLKVNQAAILIESQKPDANDILEGFRTTWGEQGGQILGLWDFSPGQTNIGTLFQDMAAKSPPVVVVLSSVAHASLFLDRAKQNFIQAPWIASDAWDDSRLGDLEAGLPTPYFFSYFHKLDPLPSVQIFAQAYYETYNVFPDQFAAKGFEATKIALEAFLIQQKTGKNLFDILDTETFQGLQNAGRFSKDKVFLQAHPFLRITSGKYKVMNRILLQD
jgi:branched-chain amino acid transport system substrate-binding protein